MKRDYLAWNIVGVLTLLCLGIFQVSQGEAWRAMVSGVILGLILGDLLNELMQRRRRRQAQARAQQQRPTVPPKIDY